MGLVSTGYILNEARETERQTTSMDAKGVIPNIDKAIDCEILNISESGALIEVQNIDILPTKFKIYMPDSHIFSECRVIWKKGDRAGIAFESQVSLG